MASIFSFLKRNYWIFKYLVFSVLLLTFSLNLFSFFWWFFLIVFIIGLIFEMAIYKDSLFSFFSLTIVPLAFLNVYLFTSPINYILSIFFPIILIISKRLLTKETLIFILSSLLFFVFFDFFFLTFSGLINVWFLWLMLLVILGIFNYLIFSFLKIDKGILKITLISFLEAEPFLFLYFFPYSYAVSTFISLFLFAVLSFKILGFEINRENFKLSFKNDFLMLAILSLALIIFGIPK